MTATGNAPNLSTNSDTLTLAGTLGGSNISLSFDGGPDAFGTISGGSFTLDFPQPDGTLAPITFSQSSATQYNSAVDKLKQDIAQANQTASNAQALEQTQQKIESDAASVQADMSSNGFYPGLAQLETSLSTSLQPLPGALQTVISDMGSTKAAEQMVASEPGTSEQCDDAGTVADDAGTVADDASGAADDVNALRETSQTLQSGFATLQQDESMLPGFIPPGAPTPSAVSKAISVANASITSGLSSANGAIDKANADVATAYQYASEAYQAGHCGAAPGPPSPFQQIS